MFLRVALNVLLTCTNPALGFCAVQRIVNLTLHLLPLGEGKIEP